MKKFKFIALLALLVSAVACHGTDPVDPAKPEKTGTIVGQWQLTNVSTKSAIIGTETVDVYLEFTSDGKFNIYQTIGAGRPRHYAGTYTFKDNVLSGKYDDGKTVKPYDVTLTKTELTLAPQGGTEVDKYKSASIPQNVIDQAV